MLEREGHTIVSKAEGFLEPPIESLNSDIGIIGAPFDTAVSYRPGKFFVLILLRHFSSCQGSLSYLCCIVWDQSVNARPWFSKSFIVSFGKNLPVIETGPTLSIQRNFVTLVASRVSYPSSWKQEHASVPVRRCSPANCFLLGSGF